MKNRKGFTLVEIITVIVILGVLLAVALPSILGMIASAKKKACLANQHTLFSQLNLELTDLRAASLQELAQTAEGAALVSACRCPSGGVITVTGNTVSCSLHSGIALTEAQRHSQLLNALITRTAGAANWKKAVVALSEGNPDYTFEPVSQALLDAYTAAGGHLPEGAVLTWKPAVGKNGQIYMIASVNDRDVDAVRNANTINQSQSYNPNAYMIYDGSVYYAPLHAYSRKPAPTYASDNALDLAAIKKTCGLLEMTVE